MATDLLVTLQELTALPLTNFPLLSVYFDMTPDGTGRRQALMQLDQEFTRIAENMAGRNLEDIEIESFEADRTRITDYINTDAPVDAAGLAIFASHGDEIWHAIPLQVPVPTRVLEAHFPHVFELARIVDDYETYAVVLADGQEARILVISLNQVEQAGETAAVEELKRFQAGGWAQMLFQRRTDNIIKAYVKDMSERLGRITRRYGVKHIIIGGNDAIKGIVLESLTKEQQAMLVDYVNLDINGNMQEIMAVIEPLMQQVEHDQEIDAVDTLEAQINTKGGMAVIGVTATALALSKGQVMQLIMLEGFQALGRTNPVSGFLYPGLQINDPYDGTPTEDIDLREAFVARAMQQAAKVQIMAAHPYLEEHEGVGALLRYRDDVVAPQQEPS